MRKNIKISTGVIFILTAIILAITLITVSIVDVENDEYALVYHTISKHFDRNQKPLEQGRYVLHPGEKIFRFKRTFQFISMQGLDAVECVSSDGLLVSLDITFQYRIRKDELVKLFSILGEDYQKVINLQTTGAIQNACSLYTSSDFYFFRQDVQNTMSKKVDENLDKVFCDGGFLQLMNVRFNPSFNNAIQLTQQASQDVTQALNERPQILIQAQTSVLEAEQFAEFVLANARADSQIILANATFMALSINATLSAQLEAYKSISEGLGLERENLINYISTQTIENAKKKTINVNSPAKFSFS